MASNIISIKTVKKRIAPILGRYPVNKAILFGSYARNEATNVSDIDLYIDTNGRLKGLDFVGLLEELIDVLGIDIDLIDKTHIEPDSLIIHEIETGGVVIYEEPIILRFPGSR
ncbi:MAG TPA: nucleotidyltransferase domain-containing protein [Clostridia bacterium]|nr:nucleotidyltransferase domain-containing protein [Clostridia bacterium]